MIIAPKKDFFSSNVILSLESLTKTISKSQNEWAKVFQVAKLLVSLNNEKSVLLLEILITWINLSDSEFTGVNNHCNGKKT